MRSLTRYPKFLVANLLKAKDRGGMASWRSRALASAAAAVKGLRYAAMNAQKARALDRRLAAGGSQL